ncbi:MAG TPA: hypothetical protein VJI67_01540 [archaeon]|nr:hypothetical protein [archaeon]
MAAIEKTMTLPEYQSFTYKVYGKPDEVQFDNIDMFVNLQRFATRAMKGIRKGDAEKTKHNLTLSFSWFISLLNRMHVDLETIAWQRFPFKCSYCATCPCACKEKKIKVRVPVVADASKKPKTLQGFQDMFGEIYPANKRTLEHAAVHLAEEIGELSEAFLAYKGSHKKQDFNNILLEAADVFSCYIGVFNSMNSSLASEIRELFGDNCYRCHKAPCECDFQTVMNYKS